MYALVPASEDHVNELSETMRPADVEEIRASSGRDPKTALTASVEHSRYPMTAISDGKVLCMYGVAPLSLLSDIGVPWLLCSKDLRFHVKPFLRVSRGIVDNYRDTWPKLVNFVDARNRSAIRWIRWAGFTVFDPVPYGVEKRPFHRFEMCNV